MHRAFHRWWSPSLHRDMSVLEFGHGGARVIAFPTSKGTFHEWEDRGMIRALADPLSRGWFHLFCVDCVDHESWYAHWKHPGARAWRQEEYDRYLMNELLPFMQWKNSHPFTIAVGASFGGYHALDFGLRHPDRINRILSMSGLCDIRRFADGFHHDNVYYHNPIEFIPHEHEPWRLEALRRQNIILAVGHGDGLIHQNRELSGHLWNKGIGNALREWDGFAHDWPIWQRQVNLYLGGHD
jgi:esterase/lipase superfamily enzyme